MYINKYKTAKEWHNNDTKDKDPFIIVCVCVCVGGRVCF